MAKHHLNYRIEDLDENGAVKPSLAMFLVGVFLSRQLFYAPLSLLAKRRGRGQRGSGGPDLDLSFLIVTSVWEFVACIPGVLILFLLLRDKSNADPKITSLWMRGRTIMLAGLVLQVFATILPYLLYGREPTIVGALLAVAYVYLCMYILRSQRIKDVFSAVPLSR